MIDAWTEPDDWQAPRPTLFVLDHTAYVTDPPRRPCTRSTSRRGRSTRAPRSTWSPTS
ncbi:hypothetical protein NKG05_16925 [Oerskovia sp. M15]